MTTTTPPQHGERRCYLRGCRRPECRAANKRYCKAYDIRRHREGPVYVDAKPCQEHLQKLLDDNWSMASIATATNMPAGTLRAIAVGDHKTCRPDTRDRILAFDPDFDADRPGHWVSAAGSMRRLRALALLGHPLYLVAEEAGISYAAVRRIGRGESAQTSKDFARRITEVFERRSQAEGPSPTTRGIARAAGWLDHRVWRDIDDPACQPVLDGKELGNRREMAAYRRAEIGHLAAYSIPEHEIAERLGMDDDYVHDLIRDMDKAA